MEHGVVEGKVRLDCGLPMLRRKGGDGVGFISMA